MRIVGFRYCYRQLQNFAGAVRHLQNWRELRQGARRERRGEILARPAVLRFRNGLTIEMGPGSYANHDFLFREIFLEKCYQPTPDFVPRPGWTVVDLGANMGFLTCQAASAAKGVRVIAVEPVYTEILRKNIAANRFADALVVPGAVCGAPVDCIPLTIWFQPSGELMTGAVQKQAVKVETINAPGYTLPKIFELGRVERCDLLKVDIEGAEFELFEKIPDEVWNKIVRVVMEVHKDGGRSEQELVRILEQKGFAVSLKDAASNYPMLWAVKAEAES